MRQFSCSISVLICLLLCLFGSQPIAAQPLYDDFSGDYLDSNKWNHQELVREVVNGHFVSKNRAVSGNSRNRTTFVNSGSINAIQADVTVVSTSLENDPDVRAQVRLDGVFFNTQFSGKVTGDVWATIRIEETGNGLEASYTIEEALDDNWDTSNIWASDTISTGLSYNQTYTLKIEYNEGLHEFTFILNSVAPVIISSAVLPNNVRTAVDPSKNLTTGIDNASSGINFVHALFDNVYINNQASAYDTFEAPLDPVNWKTDEFVREIANNRIRLNRQGFDEQSQATLSLVDSDASYVEAKVRIESDSTLSPGATGVFRIQGFYYNDSRGPGSGQDYNGYEGDVFAQLRLQMEDDRSLRGKVFVHRSDNADDTSHTLLLSQDFVSPITFDTYQTISIEYTGTSLIFKYNGETITHAIATAQYTPYGEHRALRSRVYLDARETGYIKTSVDEVNSEKSKTTLIGEFVTRFYKLCLSRDPDSAGLVGWVNLLLNGTSTGGDVANGFVFSPEFLNKNTTNEEYLQVLYEAFFNRQPDLAGLKGWLDALAAGISRDKVLNGFIYAKEFSELCEEYGITAFKGHITKTQREAVEVFVTRFYQSCLDRDPDALGLEGWVDNLLNQIQTGADVANGFIYSKEFINKNTTNDEYLTILYKAFFNRDPDQAGWDVWLSELNAGKNRGEILNGFIFSAEFSNLCCEYGINAFAGSVPCDGDGGDGNSDFVTINVDDIAGSDGYIYVDSIKYEDGTITIPNNSIVGIMKDGNGYLWYPSLQGEDLCIETSYRAISAWIADKTWPGYDDNDDNESAVYASTEIESNNKNIGIEFEKIDDQTIKVSNKVNRWAAVKLHYKNNNSEITYLTPSEPTLYNLNFFRFIEDKFVLGWFETGHTKTIYGSDDIEYVEMFGSTFRSHPLSKGEGDVLEGEHEAFLSDTDLMMRLFKLEQTMLQFELAESTAGVFPLEEADFMLQLVMNFIEAVTLTVISDDVSIARQSIDSLCMDALQSGFEIFFGWCTLKGGEILSTFLDYFRLAIFRNDEEDNIKQKHLRSCYDLVPISESPVPLFGGKNIIKNPGAEEGQASESDIHPGRLPVDISEWTSNLTNFRGWDRNDVIGKGFVTKYSSYDDDDQKGHSFPPPQGGAQFFMGGISGYKLRQKIDLSEIETDIQAGLVSFLLEADIGGYQNQGDHAIVTFGGKWDAGLELFEGITTTIGNSIGPVYPDARDDKTNLIHRWIEKPIVRKDLVEYFIQIEFKTSIGYWCDGYVDNISLKFFRRQPPPE